MTVMIKNIITHTVSPT